MWSANVKQKVLMVVHCDCCHLLIPKKVGTLICNVCKHIDWFKPFNLVNDWQHVDLWWFSMNINPWPIACNYKGMKTSKTNKCFQNVFVPTHLAQICIHWNGMYELVITEDHDHPWVNMQASVGFHCMHMGTFCRVEFNVNVTDHKIMLTLNVPIAIKVVCFSRLLKCLRSLYGKQCGPR